MFKKQATVSVTLEQHEGKRNVKGLHPVSLRVYNPATKQAKKYRTGIFAKPDQIESVKAKIQHEVERAEDIINKLRLNNQIFTFDAFERHLKSKGGSITLFEYLRDAELIQSKEANKSAIRDLRSILEKVMDKDVHFGAINHAWLLKLKQALLRHKKKSKSGNKPISTNTVNLHLRTLRRQYNIAVSEGLHPNLMSRRSSGSIHSRFLQRKLSAGSPWRNSGSSEITSTSSVTRTACGGTQKIFGL